MLHKITWSHQVSSPFLLWANAIWLFKKTWTNIYILWTGSWERRWNVPQICSWAKEKRLFWQTNPSWFFSQKISVILDQMLGWQCSWESHQQRYERFQTIMKTHGLVLLVMKVFPMIHYWKTSTLYFILRNIKGFTKEGKKLLYLIAVKFAIFVLTVLYQPVKWICIKEFQSVKIFIDIKM